MITRRTFVGALTAATAAGALGAGLLRTGRSQLSPDRIRPASLAPLRHGPVILRSADGSTLHSVVDDVTVVRRTARLGAPGTEQISVLFAADAEAGLYRVEHADVSLGELFLSPVNRAGRERRLEAVITRIV